ncbi:MAG: replicative helicase loader/inhibitor [Coprothermobacterota bacterium]|nr:replicative helicase loader/inhibitor [Coprothermobacterota bacterium]
MTKQEVRDLLTLIAQAWNNAPEMSTGTLAIWAKVLEEIPLEVAKIAVQKLLFTGKPFSPSYAEIRGAALEIVQERNLTPAEAYGKASRCIGDAVFFDDHWEAEGYEDLHPLVRRTLEHFGVREFAMADPAHARPQFMRMYEQELRRAQEEAALPPGFRKEIEALRTNYRTLPDPDNAKKAREMIEGLAEKKGMFDESSTRP